MWLFFQAGIKVNPWGLWSSRPCDIYNTLTVHPKKYAHGLRSVVFDHSLAPVDFTHIFQDTLLAPDNLAIAPVPVKQPNLPGADRLFHSP